ncbi:MULTISPECIES: hypothetical protein [Staphylococcus]|uniref:hypothetical protein n=1 Tax=Staphylococcus TaxID=1279 RepID=UPI0015C53878|nr:MULTISPECIES: hypothetical protein [Staphylococcus]MDW8543538.1 hypothetical protein [Staphylococcus sp. KG4-1]MDW8562965.1 hypothetical protein [Staphylococcus sp. KG4-3]NQE00316.1 hypothetical protein [Staphylococcus xylosus]
MKQRFMEKDYYNYNNNELLMLNNEDLIKNEKLIESVYKDYEKLEGEVIICDSSPFLFINGYFMARINNEIKTTQKLSFIEINNNNIYAYIKKERI